MFDARPLLSVLLVLVAATGTGVAAQAHGPQADTQVRPATGASVDVITVGSTTTDRPHVQSVTLSGVSLDAVDLGPPLVAIGAYSRFDDSSDPLEHDTRATIYETVTESPGLTLAQVADRTETAISTTRYHCRVLDDEGLVERERIDGHRCVFPDDVLIGEERDDLELQAAMRNDAQSDVLRAVYRQEPVSVSTLASSLDRADSTVSYHLDRLESRDLVDRHRDGRQARVRLPAPVRETVAVAVST